MLGLNPKWFVAIMVLNSHMKRVLLQHASMSLDPRSTVKDKIMCYSFGSWAERVKKRLIWPSNGPFTY